MDTCKVSWEGAYIKTNKRLKGNINYIPDYFCLNIHTL